MVDDSPSRLAALAVSRDPVTLDDVEEIEARLEGLEPLVDDFPWPRAAWLALDLGALHRRLFRASRAARVPHEDHVATRALPRLVELHRRLAARCEQRFAKDRARIRAGGLRGVELIEWIASHPPAVRDIAVECLLGMAHPPLGRQSLGVELVDYVPSGVASIVQAVVDVPVLPDDVFVDVGAGLGKVTALVHMLSGATARGLELQPSLVDHATRATSQLGLDDVAFEQVDARHADFADASIVFLYLPFVGDALRDVLERLESSRRRAVVLCTLGLDLGHVPWLRARQGEDVWLSIYDTVHGNGRSARAPSPLARIARSVT